MMVWRKESIIARTSSEVKRDFTMNIQRALDEFLDDFIACFGTHERDGDGCVRDAGTTPHSRVAKGAVLALAQRFEVLRGTASQQ